MPLPNAKKIDLLNQQIDAAKDGNPDNFDEWKATTEVALRHTVGEGSSVLEAFRKNRYSLGFFSERTPQSEFVEARRRGIKRAVGHLRAAIKEVEISAELAEQQVAEELELARTEIFIVHGRDNERKETVARFVRNLTDIEPIILHEQVSGGKTVIEKLERYAATTGFAVIIATGDDLGRLAGDDAERPRARQNVIFELGYFIGLLGRAKVVLLYDAAVERPSDTEGIVHIEIDARGAWKIELAREIEATGFTIDRDKAFK